MLLQAEFQNIDRAISDVMLISSIWVAKTETNFASWFMFVLEKKKK